MEIVLLILLITVIVFNLILLVLLQKLAKNQSEDKLSGQLRQEFEGIKNNMLLQNSSLKEELSGVMARNNQAVLTGINEMMRLQQNQLSDFAKNIKELSESNEKRLEGMRITIEERVKALQDDNAQKLEKMRETVDEKLNATLEKRFKDSFTMVSDRLEQVYKGLGEMQTLASGVGDLKKVLTNVKTRGTWGEVSLASLLEQVLIPSQYKSNVKVSPRSNAIVEFAICLPGKDDNDNTIYLPLDCKFPMEDYIRLVDASEKGDFTAVDLAIKQLEVSVKKNAMDIRDKYIKPPYTTDFAIMYLPVEGLYAEVVRNSALCEILQRDYRVTIAGPTTLGAFLNSLQMGFKTLTIEKRSSEISKLLGAIKGDFNTFSGLLAKTKKQIDLAGSAIDDATIRFDKIGKRLNSAHEIPAAEAAVLLDENSTFAEEEIENN